MRKLVLFLCVAAGAALLFSCASTPAADGPDLATAKNRADSAISKAQSVKADVAVKPDFDKARASYREAQGLEASNQAQAIAKYLESERQALAAHDATLAKRAEAQKQLDKAKSDIKAIEAEAGGKR